MTFEVPKLIYRPTKFYRLKNKDRRLYDNMTLLDEAILRHHKFNSLTDEQRYKFDKWLKDCHVIALLEGKYKGIPVETHLGGVKILIKDIDLDIHVYEMIYKRFNEESLIV